MAEQYIGNVAHYFGKARVAAIEITEGELTKGDTIHIVGHTTDFTQTVDSMQIKNETVLSARAGDKIGMKVVEQAREKDEVYLVIPD